jgi:biotin transporter BioY
MAIGSILIMLSGWGWFALVTNTPLSTAFQLTVLKFIPGDIIKIVLAAAALPIGWKLLKNKSSR